MQIQQADKKEKKLRIALYGDSGTGKTHTALVMAQTLGERILVIDSEDGASHSFSDMTSFSVLRLDEPTIESYQSALDLAIKHNDKFDVVVIDSLSQAWQNALAKVSAFSNTTLGWGKVTPQWDALIHKIKRLRSHVVVTMRAKKREEQGRWSSTYDSRDNSDYEFDLMLEMIGLSSKDGKPIVAEAKITKNRFNTDNPRLKVGGVVNAGSSLVKYIVDWQANKIDKGGE